MLINYLMLNILKINRVTIEYLDSEEKWMSFKTN